MIALSDFFADLTKLEKLLLREQTDLLKPWYPVSAEQEVDVEAVRATFRAWHDAIQKDWPPEEARQYLPLKDTPVSADQFDPHNAGYCMGGSFFYGGYHRRQDAYHRLRPPLWLGARVSIHSFSKLIGPTVIGSQVEIGSYVNITRTFLRSEVEIDNYAEVSDAMIGRGVQIGVRVTILHKPRSAGEIEIWDRRDHRCDPVRISRKRMGAVIGDGCEIGAGAILEPGVFLLPHCVVPIGAIVKTGIYGPEQMKDL